jgi:arginyl-tRNA--protein-N-Asp/Glu arginylyltransferase
MKRKKDKKLAYKIACMNCNKCYIGETRREKSTRMKEHQKDINKMADSSNIVKQITEQKTFF